jgi:(E)-4-hydroxy-3-methylbut-2-enyl-diphosphate synthase
MLGNTPVGGGAPVSVQSMTNTDTRDVEATLEQIEELQNNGCDIVRLAVPDQNAAKALGQIIPFCRIPVVADIHFDYRLAIAAIENGANGIRLNPGNIDGEEKLQAVASAAVMARVPIRIGVNSGSLECDILAKYGGVTAEGMVESALRKCAILERLGCHELKVSLKSSSVTTTIDACRLFAKKSEYPQHLGVTEAGTMLAGTVKSAIGIGALLLDGIGDTIRVSLTAPPVEEVRVAIKILEAVGLRKAQPEIVSCPTCGRTQIALEPLVKAVEEEIQRLKVGGEQISLSKIAIMGCVVNGPGEAREADIGIAGGKGTGVFFRNGKIEKTVPEAELLPLLLKEIHQHCQKQKTRDARNGAAG